MQTWTICWPTRPRRAARYLGALADRPVTPGAAARATLASFDEPLPESPGDPAATLALLDEAGSPATVASAGGRYFGFVTGGSLPIAVAASWLATAWDQNAALPVMSPVAARLHDVTSGWLADLLGLPPGTQAVFVTGSAMANTAGLAAARDRQLSQCGWDVQARGLFGAPRIDRCHRRTRPLDPGPGPRADRPRSRSSHPDSRG